MSEKRQQFDKSFETEIAGDTWHVVPTGDLPDAMGVTVYDEKMIQVVALQEDLDFLDTVVHEALHAAFPWMREWMIFNTAGDIAKLLWKLGFRKP